MRKALALSLFAIFLGGCASDPADRDISGTWINQVAIDAATQGGSLREALQAYGPNLEWDVNTKAGQARYTNGFEKVEGRLLGEQSGAWKVDFYGSSASELKRDGNQLQQAASDNEPEQLFDRAQIPVPEGVVNQNGEWYFSEFTQDAGVSSLGLDDKVPEAPSEDERKSILDIFRR